MGFFTKNSIPKPTPFPKDPMNRPSPQYVDPSLHPQPWDAPNPPNQYYYQQPPPLQPQPQRQLPPQPPPQPQPLSHPPLNVVPPPRAPNHNTPQSAQSTSGHSFQRLSMQPYAVHGGSPQPQRPHVNSLSNSTSPTSTQSGHGGRRPSSGTHQPPLSASNYFVAPAPTHGRRASNPPTMGAGSMVPNLPLPPNNPYLSNNNSRPMPPVPRPPAPDPRGRPVYAHPIRGSVSNPSLNGGGLAPPRPPHTRASSRGSSQEVNEGKISVSIDFGTTFSGVAYASSRIANGKVQQILNWPGSNTDSYRKIPTCIVYDTFGRVLAWGVTAKNMPMSPRTIHCEWFKLFLEPNALKDERTVDPRLPKLPPGKRPIDVITDFLRCLWEYAKGQITREIGAVADLDSADVLLTVPAAWDARGCQLMRQAAISARLVQAAVNQTDRNWRDRLKIITEPEAAAIHCVQFTELSRLRPGQNFMICDAGGGTIDLATYKIIGQLDSLQIGEMCSRSGANCGSLFLDLRFRELVRNILRYHPAHLDEISLRNFMQSFSMSDKLEYRGVEDDDSRFYFSCFNPADTNDLRAGLVNGELGIPGSIIRQNVFDPVIDEVLQTIEGQANKVNEEISALLLVGGFSASPYLLQRVTEKFQSRIKLIERPADSDTATLRGAAQYGLSNRPLVSSIITMKSYAIEVALPTEEEDRLKRPAYIRRTPAGFSVCEKRLQYMVAKGAVIRKGQPLKMKFRKHYISPQEPTFDLVLYTSDSDRIFRYSDEGELLTLATWKVDLSTSQIGGVSEFTLFLDVDTAEIQAKLIQNGEIRQPISPMPSSPSY